MNDEATGSLVDRTLQRLVRAWHGLARGDKQDSAIAELAPDLPDEDLAHVREQIDSCLAARGGEVSARRRAAALGESYLLLSDLGRERFLRLLASDYGIDQEAVRDLASSVANAEGGEALGVAEDTLRRALIAPRVRLLTQFNVLPEGVKFLVDMRADLDRIGRGESALVAVERDLKDLLVSWFDIGFLELRRITWDAPAHLLEKLMAYEAVHEIRSWDDLKNRLDSDRRCYAFFHPRMPEEPLIFIEVALVNGISDNIQALLDEGAPADNPEAADTAIFYSISNAQRGLAGVNFGDFLIKRVVDDLVRNLPNIKTFSTLSPIPGFRSWLDKRLEEGTVALSKMEREGLAKAMAVAPAAADPRTALARDDWFSDPVMNEALRTPLLRVCTQYLLYEKRGRRALDPVAHFHLTNGARLERLNWLANASPTGMHRSYGIMVNYLYALKEIEANHEGYRSSGKIAASAMIHEMAEEVARQQGPRGS